MRKNNLMQYLAILVLYLLTIIVFFLAIIEKPLHSSYFSFAELGILLLMTPFYFKYILHGIISPWYKVWHTKNITLSTCIYRPEVSVIVPAYNEEVGIIKTIDSICCSDYNNLEIIVINDGSQDKTDELVADYINKRCFNKNGKDIAIKYHYQENSGKAHALNKGLELASGEIIITVDADSIVQKDAINNFVKYFADPEIMCVAGNVIVGNTKKILGKVQNIEYLLGFYFKRGDSLLDSIYIVGGAAAAYRKSVFKQLGNFDPAMITEDMEMSLRIQEAGLKVRYAQDAAIVTEGPSEIKGLIKQRLRWKYGRFQSFWKFRHMFFNPGKPFSRYLTMFILPMTLFSEAILFFDIFIAAYLYTNLVLMHNFLAIASVIVMQSSLLCILIISDYYTKSNKSRLLIAPIGWLILYIINLVEYLALLGCIEKAIKRKGIKWQKWQRKGVFG